MYRALCTCTFVYVMSSIDDCACGLVPASLAIKKPLLEILWKHLFNTYRTMNDKLTCVCNHRGDLKHLNASSCQHYLPSQPIRRRPHDSTFPNYQIIKTPRTGPAVCPTYPLALLGLPPEIGAD